MVLLSPGSEKISAVKIDIQGISLLSAVLGTAKAF
jgi:hypothetical protein